MDEEYSYIEYDPEIYSQKRKPKSKLKVNPAGQIYQKPQKGSRIPKLSKVGSAIQGKDPIDSFESPPKVLTMISNTKKRQEKMTDIIYDDSSDDEEAPIIPSHSTPQVPLLPFRNKLQFEGRGTSPMQSIFKNNKPEQSPIITNLLNMHHSLNRIQHLSHRVKLKFN